MYKNIKLSASLMCADFINLGPQLKKLEKNNIDFLHIDIVDGKFATDFTMGTSIINRVSEYTTLPLDYHLMVDEPNYLFSTFKIPKNTIYTIHQECSRNLHRDLISIKKNNVDKVGVALSPGTPIEYLEYVIEDVDLILILTVNPGFKGQHLIPQIIRKISDLKNKILKMNLNTIISVDGNVNPANITDMVSAGADLLVLGSSGLFVENQTIEDSIEKIKKSIDLAF